MMWQWLALDRHAVPAYYALASAGVLAGVWACAPRPAPLAPERLPRISLREVREWVSDFTPTSALRYDLSWTYQTQRGRVRGIAAVQLAPPDSIRFDYRGPFGRSGAAVVIGDSVLWSEPEEDIENLIPVARLFWGALGIVPEPPRGVALTGGVIGESRVWRHAEGGEVFTYLAAPGERRSLKVEMSQRGTVVGTVDVQFEVASRVPARATMVFPRAATVFAITVEKVEELQGIDPGIWREP